MKITKILAVILCIGMVLSLAACDEEATLGDVTGDSSVGTEDKTNESAGSQTQLESEIETSESSEVESEIESEPETSDGDPIPGDGTLLQDITEGSEDFKNEFAANPIDTQFRENFGNATSTTQLGDAIYDTTEKWKTMVSVAYQALLDSCSTDEERENAKTVQTQWADEIDQKLENNASVAQSDPIEAALLNLNTYRDWAAELCSLKYDINGTLPSFDTENAPVAAG